MLGLSKHVSQHRMPLMNNLRLRTPIFNSQVVDSCDYSFANSICYFHILFSKTTSNAPLINRPFIFSALAAPIYCEYSIALLSIDVIFQNVAKAFFFYKTFVDLSNMIASLSFYSFYGLQFSYINACHALSCIKPQKVISTSITNIIERNIYIHSRCTKTFYLQIKLCFQQIQSCLIKVLS